MPLPPQLSLPLLRRHVCWKCTLQSCSAAPAKQIGSFATGKPQFDAPRAGQGRRQAWATGRHSGSVADPLWVPHFQLYGPPRIPQLCSARAPGEQRGGSPPKAPPGSVGRGRSAPGACAVPSDAARQTMLLAQRGPQAQQTPSRGWQMTRRAPPRRPLSAHGGGPPAAPTPLPPAAP